MTEGRGFGEEKVVVRNGVKVGKGGGGEQIR